jgi:hypothetical protein
MNERTPEQVEKAKYLSRDIRDAIERANVGPRLAIQVLVNMLGNLLIQVSGSEEELARVLNNIRDAAVQTWRRRQQPGSTLAEDS